MAMSEKSNWRPIETAPKYIKILVADKERVTVAAQQSAKCDWELAVCPADSCDGFLLFKPTHWMPIERLPGAPQLSDSEKIAAKGRQFLYAAADERGDIRDAILNDALAFLQSGRVPSEEELEVGVRL